MSVLSVLLGLLAFNALLLLMLDLSCIPGNE